MNHSIVRWLTVPDIWDFVDKKKPSVENPKEKRTASSFAMSIWNEGLDTWEHDYVMSNKPPALHKINLSKVNIWAGEEGLVKISFEVTDEDGEDIQYKVLINNEEAIPLTNFYPTPAQIEASIPITRFNEKESLLELIVIDELGLEAYFSYIIKKENRDTFTFKRVFDFKEDYITDENIEVIYGEGLALKEIGTGEVNIEIPTEGKSKISNIIIEGGEDKEEELIIERELTYLNDLGEGKVYEIRLLTEYTDIVDIEVI